MLQAFLFDFSSTLIESKTWMDLEIRGLPEAAFALLAERGIILPLAPGELSHAESLFWTARRVADTTGHETSHVDDLVMMVEALSLQERVSRSLAEETVAALHRRCLPTVELIGGVPETLHQLRGMGYRQAIISNAAYAPFLTWTLECFNLLSFFEQVVVSAEEGTRKPWPDIYRLTLERMGLSPPDAAYVGDDLLRDIVGARDAGLSSIWYRPDGPPPGEEECAVPDAIVTALDQIPALAERWRHET
jgi:HAD superfamily hydrolase (TIGR01509 family)